MVVTVRAETSDTGEIERLRELAALLGASFVVLGGPDVAAAVVQAARDSSIEHVVVGEMISGSRLSRVRPTVVDRIIDGLPGSDVHVIARLVQ
jgi:K+-sensing histidine kinase KdpD